MLGLEERPYALALLGNVAVLALVARHALRRSDQPGARSIATLAAAGAAWSAGQALEAVSPLLPLKLLATDLVFLGAVALGPVWLRLALEASGRASWLTPARTRMLWMVPGVVLAAVWTSPLHGALYPGVHVAWQEGVPRWSSGRGPVFWLHTAYAHLLLATGTVLLLRSALRSPASLRRSQVVLGLGAVLPWLTNVAHLAGAAGQDDPSPFAFGATCALFGWGLLRHGALDVVPVARDAVLDGLEDAVLVLDFHGRLVDANAAARRLFRLAEGALGQPAASVLAGWPELLDGLRAGGSRELVLERGALACEARVAPLVRQTGEPRGSLLVVRDRSERRRVEREARMLAQALRCTADCVAVADADHRLSFVNDALVATYGWPAEELLGREADVLRSPRNPPGLLELLPVETLRGGFRGEVLDVRRDGTDFPVALSASVIRDDRERPLGIVTVSRDVTEERRHAEQLRSARAAALVARDEAEAADRAKSAFLANMSHELRTPLNAILGYASLLEEAASDAGDEEFLPDLARVHEAGARLLALINDILDLSKIDAGRMSVLAERFEVADLVEEAARFARERAERAGNEFVLGAAVSGEAVADLPRLRQALFNLLDNACKFTQGGRVELRVSRHGDDLVLEVADTGIGIPEEQQERVFEPFTQVDASVRRRHGGTGLGLALSRRLARALGGELSLVSRPGQGSTLTLRVPAPTPAP
jgi:PAS domain S-box-containing protein